MRSRSLTKHWSGTPPTPFSSPAKSNNSSNNPWTPDFRAKLQQMGFNDQRPLGARVVNVSPTTGIQHPSNSPVKPGESFLHDAPCAEHPLQGKQADIAPTRVFVGGLPARCDAICLAEAFNPFGVVAESSIILEPTRNGVGGGSRGFGTT